MPRPDLNGLGGGIWEIANASRTIVEQIDLGVEPLNASDYALYPF